MTEGVDKSLVLLDRVTTYNNTLKSRKDVEYNGTVNTSQEGQNYLQTHPEMWQYYGQQQGISVASILSPDVVGSPPFLSNGPVVYADVPFEQQQQSGRIIPPPLFPESVLPVGQIRSYATSTNNAPSYGTNNQIPHYGILEQRASQPERLTENIKYPEYHSVRKHGKFQPPPPPDSDMNIPINVNRRGHLENRGDGSDTDARAMWRDYLNPQGNIYPGLSMSLDSSSGGGGSHTYPTNVENTGMNIVEGRQYYGNPKYQIERENQVVDDIPVTYTNNKRRLSASYNRRKRHIGPHDSDGIQRLISTGTLAKSLNSTSGGIDLVFATYWFFPAKTHAILPEDHECIQERMGAEETQRFDERNKYLGMTPEQFEDAVTKECLQEGDEMSNTNGEGGLGTTDDSIPQERVFESQSSYNPFDIHMGQMTIYRVHISCSCSKLNSQDATTSFTSGSTSSKQERCGKILPFEDQPWSSYMGSHADSYFPFRAPVVTNSNSNSDADSISHT